MDMKNPEVIVSTVAAWVDQYLKVPVAGVLYCVGVRATQINVLGFGGCVFAAILISQGAILAGGILFLLASSLDLFDGALARRQGTFFTFHLGGWLDSFADKAGELCPYVALLFVTTDVTLIRLVATASLLTVFMSYCKSLAAETGIELDWRETPLIGRGLRVLSLGIGLIVAGASDATIEASLIPVFLILIFAINIPILVYRIYKIVIKSI